MFVFIAAVALVLVASFLCSIGESVLLSLDRIKIEGMVAKGQRAGPIMAKFKENIDAPIAAILIVNTAAHTIGAAVAGASYSNVFSSETLWLFSLVFTLAVLLFTEIIPKTLGVTYATTLATPVAYGIKWLTWLLRPVIAVTQQLSRLLRGKGRQPVTSAEEIRLLATLGSSEGDVSSRTADMIIGATQLRHMDAADVMLPRGGIRFLHAEMTREEVEQQIREWGHSRFPYSSSRDIDDVESVILVKDLLFWLQEHDAAQIDWQYLAREPLIIPESMPVSAMLRTFQQSHRHIAMVVNEYGEVEGIATLEDVIEEIVGDILDESDVPTSDIRERYDGTLVVRGSLDMRKVSARLGVSWDTESQATTIGGLIVETLERIPAPGDYIDWQGYRVEVVNADERRVKTVYVRPGNEVSAEGNDRTDQES